MNQDQEQDEKTAAWLRNQFEHVEYSKPNPSKIHPEVERVQPGKRLGYLALAASVVTATFVSFSLFNFTEEQAWATEPSTVTSHEATQIRESCSARISTGLGDLEQSSTASTSGSESHSAKPNFDGPPTTLPKTVVIDRRKNGALGIFEDDVWRIVCLVKFDGKSWINQALTAEQKSPGSQSAVSYGGQTAWLSGESVSFLSGYLEEGKQCVKFELASGENALATCNNGRFAIWYPSTVQLRAGSLTYF